MLKNIHDRLVAEIYPDYNYIKSRLDSWSPEAMEQKITEVLDQLRRNINAKLPTLHEVAVVHKRSEPFEKTVYGNIRI